MSLSVTQSGLKKREQNKRKNTTYAYMVILPVIFMVNKFLCIFLSKMWGGGVFIVSLSV